jgi:hypothetical protein
MRLRVMCVLLVTTRLSHAVDVVIGFDDLSAGTAVTEQYAPQGVVFGREAPAPSILPVVRSDPAARSGGQVGDLNDRCYVEVCDPRVAYLRVDPLRNKVRMWVGNYGPSGQSESVSVRAYDLSGEPLGAPVHADIAGGTGYIAPFDVNSDEGDIAEVRISLGDNGAPIAIDDVTLYDPVTPPTPQFRIVADTGNVSIVQGATVTVPLTIRRVNGSTGALQFTLSGLTPGLTAIFDPNPSNGSDGDNVNLTLSASTDAQVGPANLTLAITPAPSAGVTKKQLVIPVDVQRFDMFDARVTGIEVTQGVQAIGDVWSLPVRDSTNPGAPVQYEGVRLQAGKRTVVRVFGNLRFGPSQGVKATVTLHGFRNGKELKESPLFPEDIFVVSSLGQRTLEWGLPGVLTSERVRSNGAWVFTLPFKPGWLAEGTIDLRAEVFPSSGSTSAECPEDGCIINNTFTLKDVYFQNSKGAFVVPVLLHVDGVPDPAFPFHLIDRMAAITPFGFRGPFYYSGTIDITDIVNNGDSRPDRSSDALDEVEDWSDQNFLEWLLDEDTDIPTGDMTMGVIGGKGENGSDLGVSRNAPVFDDHPVSVVNQYRPLTSVAHELIHGLGRKHASAGCGGGDNGQKAESWFPDEQGYMQGVGLEFDPGAAGGLTGPYRVFAAGGCGSNGKCVNAKWRECSVSAECDWFDFMSYCADNKSAWISPRGWDAIAIPYQYGAGISQDASGSAMAARHAAVAGRRAASAATVFRVRARLTDSGISITKVGVVAVQATHPPPPADSPYHLVVRGADGTLLNEQPMAMRDTHVHDSSHATSLQADILSIPEGAEQVDVIHLGDVVATRRRSAHAPEVTLSTPKRIGPVGEITIHWQVIDADGDPTRSALDFSEDDGGTWRPVFMGPSPAAGSYTLRREFFRASRRARLRLRANDGFNETTVVSNRFVVKRRRPVARILSPSAEQMVIANATLTLQGEAEDDGVALADSKLRWFVGRRRVGSGRALSLTNLRPGKRVVRLLARNQGKTGKATVTIHVVAPQR